MIQCLRLIGSLVLIFGLTSCKLEAQTQCAGFAPKFNWSLEI